MSSLHDLRNYLRLDTSFDVHFKVLPDESKHNHRAQAIDVGAGGVKIFSDRSLEKGTELELTFYVNPKTKSGKVVKALGNVMWSREIKVDNRGLGRYEVGVRFEEINTKDRDLIFQYVYRRLAAQERARTLLRRVQF